MRRRIGVRLLRGINLTLAGLVAFFSLGDCRAAENATLPPQGCATVLDPETALRVGTLYDTGLGVPQNFAMAVECYRWAAAAGNVQAQFNLATMYKNGRGVPVDPPQAALWYQKAAEQGNGRAAYVLGMMYETGEGNAPDPAQALKWYRVAAQNGVLAARDKLAAKGERIAQKMPRQGVQATAKVFTNKSGRQCRMLSSNIVVNGTEQTAYSVLCRENGGHWVIVPFDF
jgi:Sel1 repeat